MINFQMSIQVKNVRFSIVVAGASLLTHTGRQESRAPDTFICQMGRAPGLQTTFSAARAVCTSVVPAKKGL